MYLILSKERRNDSIQLLTIHSFLSTKESADLLQRGHGMKFSILFIILIKIVRTGLLISLQFIQWLNYLSIYLFPIFLTEVPLNLAIIVSQCSKMKPLKFYWYFSVIYVFFKTEGSVWSFASDAFFNYKFSLSACSNARWLHLQEIDGQGVA